MYIVPFTFYCYDFTAFSPLDGPFCPHKKKKTLGDKILGNLGISRKSLECMDLMAGTQQTTRKPYFDVSR